MEKWHEYFETLGLEEGKPKAISPKLTVERDADYNLDVNGVKFRVLSWEWFGINLGIGALNALGGLIFTQLVNALFGGKSIEQLLAQQLEAIANIIKQEIAANELKKNLGSLEALRRDMAQYNAVPNLNVLIGCLAKSSELVGQTTQSDFLGYQSFLTAVGMRIGILLEATKVDAGYKRIVYPELQSYVAHHNKINRDVLRLTDPLHHESLYRQSLPITMRGSLTGRPFPPKVVEEVYGQGIKGKLIRDVDWGVLRKTLLSNSTKYGDIIVESWGARRVRKFTSIDIPIFGSIAWEYEEYEMPDPSIHIHEEIEYPIFRFNVDDYLNRYRNDM